MNYLGKGKLETVTGVRSNLLSQLPIHNDCKHSCYLLLTFHFLLIVYILLLIDINISPRIYCVPWGGSFSVREKKLRIELDQKTNYHKLANFPVRQTRNHIQSLQLFQFGPLCFFDRLCVGQGCNNFLIYRKVLLQAYILCLYL